MGLFRRAAVRAQCRAQRPSAVVIGYDRWLRLPFPTALCDPLIGSLTRSQRVGTHMWVSTPIPDRRPDASDADADYRWHYHLWLPPRPIRVELLTCVQS